jgi:hypothetical protein
MKGIETSLVLELLELSNNDEYHSIMLSVPTYWVSKTDEDNLKSNLFFNH